jgi:hypothetical protein
MGLFRNHSRGQPLLLNDDGSSTGCRDQPFNGGIRLYDSAVLLELPTSVCKGYVTLLTGGDSPEQARTSAKIDDDKALTLAYASLTGGNVIDACFGARPGSSKESRTFAATLTKEAKEKLDQITDDDERVEKIAVEAYLAAFQTVINMHNDISKLNFITACFCTKKIRNKAVKKLETDFFELEQALNNS